jgi:ribosomal protein L10
MSKKVKDLIARDISERLEGVESALLVNVVGIDANSTVLLRKQLYEQNIHLLVVKNSLAKRATEGTPLAPAFNGVEGNLALVWGAEDFVSLAKQISALGKSKKYEKFETRGGVMDGEQLSPARVLEISKWPSRTEQLSILMGQILSPGANLAGALLGPGGALASQIEQLAKGEAGGGEAGSEEPTPPPSDEPAAAAEGG